MQESAEICTLKNSHARQNNPTSLMISKRLVMVCVRQETSNSMFTILSLNLVSINVLTTIINVPYMADSRLFFIAVTRSFRNSHALFSLCFDLIHQKTINLRLPHVTDVRLYVTQQLSKGAFNATVHLRHIERSEFVLTVQDPWLLSLGCWKMQSFTEVLRNEFHFHTFFRYFTS